MRKEFFVESEEEMENYEVEYNLEDGGMSGLHDGWHWFYDDNAEIDVYFKNKLN